MHGGESEEREVGKVGKVARIDRENPESRTLGKGARIDSGMSNESMTNGTFQRQWGSAQGEI